MLQPHDTTFKKSKTLTRKSESGQHYKNTEVIQTEAKKDHRTGGKSIKQREWELKTQYNSNNNQYKKD